MVWNQRIAFRTFFIILIIIFASIIYFLFFDNSEDPLAEKIFDSIGFKSIDERNTPAVPLPSSTTGAGGGSSGGSGSGGGGSGGSTTGSGSSLRFCTFDAYHTITSEVPCRCGFSGVCYSLGSVCDATFNNGQGICS